MNATTRAVILGLTAILIGLPLTGWAFLLTHNTLTDFRAYYIAGYMLRTAQPLYDSALEMEVQNRNVSAEAIAVPFLHPAYEALVFVPLSFFTYVNAYWVWFGVNLTILACVYRLLRPELLSLSLVAPWMAPAALAAFLPLGAAIVQGQDTLVVLLFLALAFARFRSSTGLFVAGMLLGLAVFRFQIMIPIIVCFLLWRRWKIVLGFSVTALAAALLSLAVAGFRPYVNVIFSLSLKPELAYLGPVYRMPNLRGLIHSLGGSESMILLASLAILAVTVMAGRGRELQQQLACAVAAAALIGYHAFVYDLSILLIPLALLIGNRQNSSLVITGICFLTPTLFMFAPDHLYLAAVVVLALFTCLVVTLRHWRTHPRFACGPDLDPTHIT
jgi:hypothetical protein